MRLTLVAATALVLLGACAGMAPAQEDDAMPPAIPPAEDDTCAAAGLADMIGAPREAVEAALAERVAARTARVLAPGQPMTMDYRADRINVMLDDDGVVTRLTCG